RARRDHRSDDREHPGGTVRRDRRDRRGRGVPALVGGALCHRAHPGRRWRDVRGPPGARNVAVTRGEPGALDIAAAPRAVAVELPSRPFREELARRPRLVAGGLALRRCPRVHMKAVVVDGELLYLGSANWTGAGLGARGSGRRNFELGVVTDDALLLDEVQSM